MTALTIPIDRPLDPSTRDAGFAIAALTFARRTIYKFLRTPQLLVVGTIQGAMFLLIFRYVFGGAIGAGPLSYVDFLVPGFITTGVLFAGTAAAAGVAEEADQGLYDRLRSLPIPRIAVLAGRALADTAMLVMTSGVAVAIGFAVGFRLHTDVPSALGAFALCGLFGFAFEWLFICMGFFAKNAQAAQGMSLLVFPLSFVSSAYVPSGTMPGWMQTFANNQPLTFMVDAVRGLTVGHTTGQSTTHAVVFALVWSAALIVLFAPLAAALYRRR